jgi:hypothetical protein
MNVPVGRLTISIKKKSNFKRAIASLQLTERRKADHTFYEHLMHALGFFRHIITNQI